MRDHEEILIALRRITRAIDIQSRRLLKSTGLTTSQLLILQAIEKLSNPTPSALARLTGTPCVSPRVEGFGCRATNHSNLCR